MIVSPSGSLLRLKSSILEFSLLDSSLHFQDRAVPLENLRFTVRKRDEVTSSAETGGDPGTGPPAPLGDQIILVVSCERGASCFSLPSQKQIYTYKCPDFSSHLQAQTVAWLGDKKTTSVLLLATSDGKVKGEMVDNIPTLTDLSSFFSYQPPEIPVAPRGLTSASDVGKSFQDSEILHGRSRHLLYQSKPGQTEK